MTRIHVIYLFDQAVFYTEESGYVVECRNGTPMRLGRSGARGLVWRCPLRNCCNRSQKPARLDSFFYRLKAPLERNYGDLPFLYGAYTYDPAGYDDWLERSDIAYHHKALLSVEQDLTMDDVKAERIPETDERIIVEIDESKFGKRKDNRGHPVDGVWWFKIVVLDIAEDCQAILVLKDSHINTDCWSGYNRLDEIPDMNYVHFPVNHSENFVDPVHGTHTNTIEGTWNGIKQNVTARHRTKKMMPWKLVEFIWRRKHDDDCGVVIDQDGQDEDGFESLINTILEDHHEDGHRRRRRRIDDLSDGRCSAYQINLVMNHLMRKAMIVDEEAII
ncbi:hypothetical protein O0I10_012242 [Lichtheimia ornata]|uniref:ISXO2-like transposase domain-containing protein n=1 Tax=Lichtheimia ornata TaxID=688661 RepID=A0AAD7URY2_9FUNG|nr:uncharacterized protein O0I10_012242 [Lichtheimia ornata]KAJ8652135.1 hypothetical protein O0I10_012242 [Lichtheimia ornata]